MLMKWGQSQWIAFFVLLGCNALLAFLTFALGLQKELLAGQEMPPELANVPGWALGLANAAMIAVSYGLAGALGLWLGEKAGLPGTFRLGGGLRAWVWRPMALGLIAGALMVAGDRLFAALGRWEGFAHPGFPLSLFASATAGIGEEIVFRGFVMGLAAFVLCLVFRRSGATGSALWIANGIAALAFVAGHAPLAMNLLGVQSPLHLPAAVLADLVVLNGLVALVAGAQYMRGGLVAAMGVHFWADVAWHVVWPLAAGIP
jgi:hypothetical protein